MAGVAPPGVIENSMGSTACTKSHGLGGWGWSTGAEAAGADAGAGVGPDRTLRLRSGPAFEDTVLGAEDGELVACSSRFFRGTDVGSGSGCGSGSCTAASAGVGRRTVSPPWWEPEAALVASRNWVGGVQGFGKPMSCARGTKPRPSATPFEDAPSFARAVGGDLVPSEDSDPESLLGHAVSTQGS
jgi:hypothetical protein